MSTESLRKDHKLIEKVLQALDATIKLLKDGKQIPEEILSPTLDFTQNFTDVKNDEGEVTGFQINRKDFTQYLESNSIESSYF